MQNRILKMEVKTFSRFTKLHLKCNYVRGGGRGQHVARKYSDTEPNVERLAVNVDMNSKNGRKNRKPI